MSSGTESVPGVTIARAAALAELRRAERFLLVCHEHPDGDALGSLSAMHQVLVALGKDSLMFIAPDELPLPYEYRFIAFDGLVTGLPDDLAERTIVFLDCGNVDRNPAGELRGPGARILNLDHHHDNTRFGDVNLVDDGASCTAEIVWELMRELGVAPTRAIAEALYVGLVTDTGRFMYDTTGARAHVMAAELIEAGVDVPAIYRRLYENVPEARLRLLARGLAGVERYDDGVLTITRLTRADYDATGADESHSEGVVDYLRSVSGTAVAGLARDLLGDGREGRCKVSLRASDDRVDVSAVARSLGGGGHRRAAGFTTELPWAELIELLRREVAAQLV